MPWALESPGDAMLSSRTLAVGPSAGGESARVAGQDVPAGTRSFDQEDPDVEGTIYARTTVRCRRPCAL